MDDDGRQILIMLHEQQLLQQEQLVILARAVDLIIWMVKNPGSCGDDGDDGGPGGPAPGHTSPKDHKVQPQEPEFLRGFQ